MQVWTENSVWTTEVKSKTSLSQPDKSLAYSVSSGLPIEPDILLGNIELKVSDRLF